MSDRPTGALVLVFTPGVSLKLWSDAGILERELALYGALRDHVARIIFLTHGNAGDADALPHDLRDSIEVIPTLGHAERAIEQAGDRLQDEPSIVVKTNQLEAGAQAVTLVDALRRRGADPALIARGGFGWSFFEERIHGPASTAARAALEGERRVCLHADAVAVTTRTIAEDLLARHPIPRERVHVIPNYVVIPSEPDPAERAAREVLFAGRVAPQKRVDLLIRAVARITPVVHLRVVGEGPDKQAIQGLAERLGVRATFEPRLPQAQLHERMRRCTVYAQASGFEGHPKAILEAMALATPVVATRAPGHDDTIDHDRTGLLAHPDPDDLANAIARLLDDRSHAHNLGAAARAHVAETCSLQRVVELEQAVYRAAQRSRSTGEARPCRA